ncbi:hypothetical protein [Kibdelosporangium philippinense]|uniref:hypothetical protein n=1 Tax=Kibdelosporangium philippinense TaxID=211113 RepID=UPI00360F98ED
MYAATVSSAAPCVDASSNRYQNSFARRSPSMPGTGGKSVPADAIPGTTVAATTDPAATPMSVRRSTSDSPRE